ncbi:MAG: hypothetical protein K5656_12035 [Lachnospiraceae bacterium]|nr:hypothetical protein [Lachnospiraceae bacterium]
MSDVEVSAVEKDIVMMARVSSNFDLKEPMYANAAINYVKKADPFRTGEIGDMFMKRMKLYAEGNYSETTCLVCRRFPAVNGLVCESCLNKVYPQGVSEQIFSMDSPTSEDESLVIAARLRSSRNRWRIAAIVEIFAIVGLVLYMVASKLW